MRILILEDNIERIEKFKILFKNHQVTFCDTVLGAYNACLQTEFQIMLLDHDLGGKIWEDSDGENNGYQFIKLLVSKGLQKNSLNYIHSMNVIGANKILNYLIDNGYDAIWHPYHLWKL